MNIGIVCYPTYGGSGVVATELGMALAERGHRVHFINYRRPARLSHYWPDIFYHEVAPMEYPLFEFKPMDTALASKIVDVALFENLDILHVHYALPHATIGFLSREILKTKGKHLPFVTTLHGTDITLIGADRSYFPVVEFSINQSDAVTAVSASLRQQTLDTFHMSKEIHVIPNFIDFARFGKKDNTALRNQFAEPQEKLIMHVSNFRKVKRIDDAIAVFRLIRHHLPAKMLLVGDGPERPRLEALCRDWDLCNHVKFLGKQDMVDELLSIADLFMLPSEHESFGLAALEAMACEVPVIASNAGGLSEVVIDGQSGWTCPVGEVQYMFERALELLSDDHKLRQFKAAALERAKQFDIHRILPLYENVYSDLLK